MHPYLSHLLADIKNAEREATPMIFTPKSFKKEMEEIENWVQGFENNHTFGDYCGLKAENFPPAEQLTDEEMEIICKAFRKLMFTWNHEDSFPEVLPIAWTYNLLVETLNEGTFIPDCGIAGFDHCTGYAPDCIYKQYCPCLKFWNAPYF